MIRASAVVVAGVALLAACGGGDDPAPAATQAPAATAAPSDSAAAPAGDTAITELQFTAPLVGGGQIDMSELGDQPVLLWFWAPW